MVPTRLTLAKDNVRTRIRDRGRGSGEKGTAASRVIRRVIRVRRATQHQSSRATAHARRHRQSLIIREAAAAAATAAPPTREIAPTPRAPDMSSLATTAGRPAPRDNNTVRPGLRIARPTRRRALGRSRGKGARARARWRPTSSVCERTRTGKAGSRSGKTPRTSPSRRRARTGRAATPRRRSSGATSRASPSTTTTTTWTTSTSSSAAGTRVAAASTRPACSAAPSSRTTPSRARRRRRRRRTRTPPMGAWADAGRRPSSGSRGGVRGARGAHDG